MILDFFAGSGTTGNAVLKYNAEHEGSARRFILCTNNENGICRDVTYERIRRVIDKEDYAASLKYYKVDYGTEDSTEIWMLRYGFSFEEIEWLKPCVESIDQTEIRFNGEIESLDDFQRSSIAQYLF